MDDFRIAVKAFIVKDGKLLTLKRIPNEVHYAGKWDIPGGRLEIGEDPFPGIKREVKEETGLDIDILLPFSVKHFVRDDKQKITMIIFLCKLLNHDIKLSKAHTEYKWSDLKKDELQDWLVPIRDDFFKYKLDKLV